MSEQRIGQDMQVTLHFSISLENGEQVKVRRNFRNAIREFLNTMDSD